jgi:hypothetical protein
MDLTKRPTRSTTSALSLRLSRWRTTRYGTTPDLEVQLSFVGGECLWEPEFKGDEQLSEPFFLECTVVNHSPAPAYYAIVEVWVDHDLTPAFSLPSLKQIRITTNDRGQDFRVYQQTITSPPGVPIFKEAVHDSHVAQIPIQLPLRLWESSFVYFETIVHAPGCSKKERWFIDCKSGQMSLSRNMS